ncbi:replication initiation negative regulator SeqA [Morganella psychrotolerans]|uniref:Replication initiation negative regulator SeqA n=1 Tax=Morganella psychrotolerans TaxID=368603 RepID=A0A5M9RA63_9GAMM|nr:replication initiation negative regulator SeqA [Morganella psychrotolerans]KAA8717157.1 replication initiation negative regulator SeqA [Morganella psychrotolerans]
MGGAFCVNDAFKMSIWLLLLSAPHSINPEMTAEVTEKTQGLLS